ncbi:hypothetical protein GCM10010168_18000 [Actinoplanes ianthinogenes]|uniref:DUF1996 domain-containing protein n=1 Tax=Actinoplanes ianthinogenes TaxID=122358 RepID=A0ABN6CQF8_9ACTN|nr:DUF1996 domain-containing protein [Actinoplanes ianthinogenes]BCJ47442.1 hypothetical protein Aiant_80990 [Actinoplanes ianthinogenes]GGR01790.1 hypothetical protein GCM10010168_18000 [Actinoplanes ianthinogenes]
MTARYRRPSPKNPVLVRILAAGTALAAAGVLTVTFVSGGGDGKADASTSLNQYVPIERVAAGVVNPPPGRDASRGRFTVDCGTNGNGKFSPDNPVAQPGIRNGAEHVHDFVGNKAITAFSSDADLDASGTTCRNGDKSSYFWPVVRIDKSVRADDATVREALSGTSGAVVCPAVRDRLPAVPDSAKASVAGLLSELDRMEASADRRILAVKGVNADLNNEVLRKLGADRTTALTRMGDAIRRAGGRWPSRMVSMADCDISYDGVHEVLHTAGAKAAPVATPQIHCPGVRDKIPGVPAPALAEVDRSLDELDRQISEADERLVATRGQGGAAFVDNAILGPLKAKRIAVLDRIATAIGRTTARPDGLEKLAGCTLDGRQSTTGQGTGRPSASPSAVALPDPQGPNLELPNNTGGIVRPASVLIEYRGNPVSKVVPMPKFLRALTGDAKPTSRGPANARATWTCSGFADRLSDKYPVCPEGRQVQRVQDFPGCWDGKNTDSANHRSHVAFADRKTGACPAGFVAIPQLRITLSYKISRAVQLKGQYALDSFPEENHNPFSDHNDFVNVNSARTMQRIATCINKGKNCR